MIKRASLSDIHLLVPLFDQYREFYRQKSDLIGAEKFLFDRISLNQSVLFISMENEKALGFTQLYPSFSSVTMESLWILNDLFVVKEARGQAVGESLLKAAEAYARETNAKGLVLETGFDNPAQKLYEKLGWTINPDKHYQLYFKC